MNGLTNQRETFFQKNENERIIKSRMYNNLASSLNFHENYFSLQTQQQCAAQDFLKISYHFWSIFGKKKKNLAKWEKLCSGHLLNWKISLFVSDWTMIDVMQTRMNCISVWIAISFYFTLNPTHPKNIVKIQEFLQKQDQVST